MINGLSPCMDVLSVEFRNSGSKLIALSYCILSGEFNELANAPIWVFSFFSLYFVDPSQVTSHSTLIPNKSVYPSLSPVYLTCSIFQF